VFFDYHWENEAVRLLEVVRGHSVARLVVIVQSSGHRPEKKKRGEAGVLLEVYI